MLKKQYDRENNVQRLELSAYFVAVYAPFVSKSFRTLTQY